MTTTNTATAVAGVAVALAGGVIALSQAFNGLSSPPSLAGDLETLLRFTFEAAPVVVVLLVGVLIIQGFDLL
jgi:hypothetical protein